MNKKGKAVFGIFGIILISGQALHAAGLNTVGNLTETSVKISSIDMQKSPNDAAKVFSALYSGSKAAGDRSQSEPVYFGGNSGQRPSEQDINRLCNAKPRKITRLGKAVPAPSKNASDIPEDRRPIYWHGPNPNPSNDPAIQQGLENGVNNYCEKNPSAPACNPSNPYSPYHDPNSLPETDPQAYGSNYYWNNRLKESVAINSSAVAGNAK